MRTYIYIYYIEEKERNHPRLIKTRLSQEGSIGGEAAQLIGTDSHDKSSSKSPPHPPFDRSIDSFCPELVIRSVSTLHHFCPPFFQHRVLSLSTNNVYFVYKPFTRQIIYRDKSSPHSQIFTINPPWIIPSKVFIRLDNIPSKTSSNFESWSSLNIGTMLEKRRANIISRLLSSANG